MTGLRALLAAATPRPWEIDGIIRRGEVTGRAYIDTADAALIVALVNCADELLAATEAAQVATLEWRDSNPFVGYAMESLNAALAALDAKTGAA